MTEAKQPEAGEGGAPTVVAPALLQGQSCSVRVTDRGDGWPLGSGADARFLRSGETVEVSPADARDLVAAGFAEWTTRVKATGVEVVTTRAVLAKGQTANVDPSEAERLVKAGLAEVVKGEGE